MVLVEIYVTVLLPVVLCEENAQNRNPPPRLARLALEREKGGVLACLGFPVESYRVFYFTVGFVIGNCLL